MMYNFVIMRKQKYITFISCIIIVIALFMTTFGGVGGCGGGSSSAGGGGSGTDDSDDDSSTDTTDTEESSTEEGSSINDGWEVESLTCTGTVTGGTFVDDSGLASVSVDDGEMSPCVNATADPTLTSSLTLADGMTLDEDEGESNVTDGGAAYDFDIQGDDGFDTTTSGDVTITLPFDTDLVPVADRTSLNVFVRILDLDDYSEADLTGTISGGTITVESAGLPRAFSAAVVYNADMEEVDSESSESALVSSAPKDLTGVPPWPANRWCVVFNPSSAALINAVKSVEGIAGTPTLDQIQSAMQDYVAGSAVSNQDSMEAAGLRAPNLYVASTAAGPCGATSGTTKRYMIHMKTGSTLFRANDLSEVVNPDGNHYGRLYIDPKYIAYPTTNALGGIRSIVGHEMLHAVQSGYELMTWTTKGYTEGTATVYQMTINNGGTIAVRSSGSDETKMLSDYLGTDGQETTANVEYANQDFFAYVGRKYHGGSLGYLAGMYEEMHDEIEAAVSGLSVAEAAALRKRPPRDLLLEAIDSYFQSGLSTPASLVEIYLDFLRQRAFDHNTESQFGRSGETVIGFADELFQTSSSSGSNAIASVIVNADDCSMGGETGTFGSVAPLAARAIQITTGSTYSAGRKITVTLTPSSGAIGTTFDGFSYRNGTSDDLSSSNEFTSFGSSSTDEIDIAVANITTDTSLYFDYEVTCDDTEEEEEETGANSFSFTQFSASETFTPVYAVGQSHKIIVGSSSDVSDNPVLVLFLNGVSGTGTYTLSESGSPMDLMYYTSGINTYHQTGGTLTLTAFGTSNGDHMTGSFTASIEDDTAPPDTQTGTIGATFDIVVGEQGAL